MKEIHMCKGVVQICWCLENSLKIHSKQLKQWNL